MAQRHNQTHVAERACVLVSHSPNQNERKVLFDGRAKCMRGASR